MASSSSASSSAPALLSQSWKYDVFLSFRGEDTRKTFVGHLYSALEQQGIHTYKDDETLPRGESIHPSLMKAIEESQIAVIIFSKNYADSSWCLDELAHVMKCRDTRGQIVMPIFYDVDPSDVRKQKRKYEEAFAKHELENKAKVESWRKALVDASNISGWEPKHIANGDESEVIQQIVVEISQRLQLVISSADENLIGIAARVRSLNSELKVWSGGVRMIGIWGLGGGGKTTLASSIYDEISSKFNGCCFLKNIREESSKNGLEKLQGKILSAVLKQKEVQEFGRVEEGRRMIKQRLCRRKVLIVLDDVDRLDQLKALAGSHDWFGDGSRVIITTRDVHVLKAHLVDVRHSISLLNDDEAIMLFCNLSPQEYRPKEHYDRLSKEVISYAGGLPLALTVLGSFLCDKDIKEWRSALARLKEIPNDDIVGKLKISFDGLTKIEKELFLDIACFFRGEEKDIAMERLEACGFHPVIGVKVLIQKALITISKHGRFDVYENFDMHDLVQEMGHHIVRGEHPNNPERHSRVWKEEDVLKICAMDVTTELDKIEAIRMVFPSSISTKEVQDRLSVAANMKNLRCMISSYDPAKTLFNDLPLTTLCCLKLYGGLQEQLWEGCKFLPSLKLLKLACMNNLMKTPDFKGLPNLESFNLQMCMRVKEIHPSSGCLEKLVFLCIQDCESLEIFPPLDLNHSYCGLGDEDTDFDVLELPNLQRLNLSKNKFSRLSFSRWRLPQLKWLDVSDCKKLVELADLPSSIAVVVADNCESLESIGDISNCKWLWKVSLWEKNKVCPHVGEMLLASMLEGNAIEHHFISVSLQQQIPRGFVGRFFRGKTFTKRLLDDLEDDDDMFRLCLPDNLEDDDGMFRLCLPDDWCNDFCGFLIRIVTDGRIPSESMINIIIKQEGDGEDSRFEQWREFDEPPEPESKYHRETKYYGETIGYMATTQVGCVSFSSLRRTTSLNSSYNIISFSIYGIRWTSFAVELIPKKSKDDLLQTTDSSEFWDGEDDEIKSFKIQQVLESSTNKILVRFMLQLPQWWT